MSCKHFLPEVVNKSQEEFKKHLEVCRSQTTRTENAALPANRMPNTSFHDV